MRFWAQPGRTHCGRCLEIQQDLGQEPDCGQCEHPEPLQPGNQLAWRLYSLVCDQVRPVWAGWPPLDLAAVCATLERLGLEPRDWGGLLGQLKRIHAVVGECGADGQPG